MQFIILFNLSLSLQIFFLFYAVQQYIFVYCLALTCHCALVRGNFVGLDQNSICGDLHPLGNINNISHQEFIHVKLDSLSSSSNAHNFLIVCHIVELLKLPLLLVVVHCSNHSADKYCHKHSKPRDPSDRPILC